MAKFYSRLEKKEELKNRRRTIAFGVLTLGLVLIFIFAGIPLLIKFAVFLGDLRFRNTPSPEEQQDDLPPAPPRLIYSFDATSSAQIEIAGLSESESVIEIYLDDTFYNKVAANSEGEFQAEIDFSEERPYIISAIAKDEAGNSSERSGEITITYDTIPPSLELSAPANNSVVENQSIEIVGRTDEGSRITINDSVVIVEPSGDFSSRQILSEGKNTFKIIAKDRAGNRTETELNITYEAP